MSCRPLSLFSKCPSLISNVPKITGIISLYIKYPPYCRLAEGSHTEKNRKLLASFHGILNTHLTVDWLKGLIQRVICSSPDVGHLVLPGIGAFVHVEKLHPISVNITFFWYFVQDKPDKDTMWQYRWPLMLSGGPTFPWGFNLNTLAHLLLIFAPNFIFVLKVIEKVN